MFFPPFSAELSAPRDSHTIRVRFPPPKKMFPPPRLPRRPASQIGAPSCGPTGRARGQSSETTLRRVSSFCRRDGTMTSLGQKLVYLRFKLHVKQSFCETLLQCSCTCFRLLTGVPTSQPPLPLQSDPVSSSCHPIPSVPHLLHSSVCPPRCLAAIFPLFLFLFFFSLSEVCGSTVAGDSELFPHEAAKFSVVVFSLRVFIFGFFWRDDISAGEPSGPERVLSPWGIISGSG